MLLRILVSLFMRDTYCYFFFLVGPFPCFDIRLMLPSQNDRESVSSASIFLKKMENWYNFFFKCLVGLTRKPPEPGTCSFGTLFIIDSISPIDTGFFRLLVTHDISFGRAGENWSLHKRNWDK